MTGPVFLPEMTNDVENQTKASIKLFEAHCDKAGLEFRTHYTPVENVVNEIRKESRYADLLVLSSEKFYTNLGTERQHEYLLHVLHQSECPVVLVPERFEFPETLVIAFDGSPASAYAIRQFSGLFPQLTGLKTILVHAGVKEQMPDWEYAEEMINRHFPNLTVHSLVADPKKYFDSWVMDNRNPMVIAGAYSRSFISEMMKKSFVSTVVEEHYVPVFIAHR